MESILNAPFLEDVRPYTIHVSSKYLNLTQKKLELTRLPHEVTLPVDREWDHGTPKSEIEPLIDFWLEKYSWRDQEAVFNATVQQFRTVIHFDETAAPLRVHFIHMRSSRRDAIPLLVLPAFPLSNLSLIPLVQSLTAPPESSEAPSFHVVVPSIPGLGFSDAFALESETVIKHTASMFNTLMLRLGYDYYIATNSGSGEASPDHIDYHLASTLAANHPEHCVGVHLIAPPLSAPTLWSSPLLWFKYQLWWLAGGSIFGYSISDSSALRRRHQRRSSLPIIIDDGASSASSASSTSTSLRQKSLQNRYFTIGLIGLREPNTLAYALCDSPIGILSIVLSALRHANTRHRFTKTEIINFTELAWLPGPEAGMRFWASAVKEIKQQRKRSWCHTPVGVTAFVDEDRYSPPCWARTAHNLVWSHRIAAKSGLVSWDHTAAIVDGVRGMSQCLRKIDARVGLAELDEVVVAADADPKQSWDNSFDSTSLSTFSILEVGMDSVISLPDAN